MARTTNKKRLKRALKQLDLEKRTNFLLKFNLKTLVQLALEDSN